MKQLLILTGLLNIVLIALIIAALTADESYPEISYTTQDGSAFEMDGIHCETLADTSEAHEYDNSIPAIRVYVCGVVEAVEEFKAYGKSTTDISLKKLKRL